MWSGRCPLYATQYNHAVEIRALVEAEAAAAKRAAPALADAPVSAALRTAARLVRERRAELLAANGADVEAAIGDVDKGLLDRLRLDEKRVETLAVQAAAMAELPPLPRDGDEQRLENGLSVRERSVPIGVVGANFEARPNVALDVAAQFLKSLNAGVLRTGGAALRTVTVLVDAVIRPALESAGLPPEAIGLVRTPQREGARALVSLPRLIPVVILRGSGAGTTELARLAAQNGVRTLQHAEGGGVMYVHPAASPEKALALADAGLDRLGVCQRLNLCLVDRAAAGLVPALLEVFRARGLEIRGDVDGALPLDEPIGHEWASDPDRIATVTVAWVDGLEQAVEIAETETSGIAATIVTEDEAAARRFLSTYRGTAACWNATTRFLDGFELTGAPETGINVDWVPGPRGPVTYRDLWLRQYQVIGDGTQRR
jgi:glutamate-5-semialdehyde dehydrogenase